MIMIVVELIKILVKILVVFSEANFECADIVAKSHFCVIIRKFLRIIMNL